MKKLITNHLLFLIATIVVCCIKLLAGFSATEVNVPEMVFIDWLNQSTSHQLSTQALVSLWSTIVASRTWALTVGALSVPFLAEKLGRKKSLVAFCVPLCLGDVFASIATKFFRYDIFILGRILSGISEGGTTAIIILFLIEISPTGYRGTVGSVTMVFRDLGILFGICVSHPDALGSLERLPYLFSVVSIFAFMVGVALTVFPETARYLLITKGNFGKAALSIKFYNPKASSDQIAFLLDEMKQSNGKKQTEESAETENQNDSDETDSEDNNHFSIEDAKCHRKPLIIETKPKLEQHGICEQNRVQSQKFWKNVGLTVAFSIAITSAGRPVLFSYSSHLVHRIGVCGYSADLWIAAIHAFPILGSFITTSLVDRIGRRPLMLGFGMIVLACESTLGILLYVMDKPAEFTMYEQAAPECFYWHNHLFALVAVLWATSATGGFASLLFMVGELYDQKTRSIGMMIRGLVAYSWGAIVQQTFEVFEHNQPGSGFLALVTSLGLSLGILAACLPETMNKRF